MSDPKVRKTLQRRSAGPLLEVQSSERYSSLFQFSGIFTLLLRSATDTDAGDLLLPCIVS
jgi:hypothetical protein